VQGAANDTLLQNPIQLRCGAKARNTGKAIGHSGRGETIGTQLQYETLPKRQSYVN